MSAPRNLYYVTSRENKMSHEVAIPRCQALVQRGGRCTRDAQFIDGGKHFCTKHHDQRIEALKNVHAKINKTR